MIPARLLSHVALEGTPDSASASYPIAELVADEPRRVADLRCRIARAVAA
jgi:plasmid replication initiation protein